MPECSAKRVPKLMSPHKPHESGEFRRLQTGSRFFAINSCAPAFDFYEASVKYVRNPTTALFKHWPAGARFIEIEET
jgi:hypothetical protein